MCPKNVYLFLDYRLQLSVVVAVVAAMMIHAQIMWSFLDELKRLFFEIFMHYSSLLAIFTFYLVQLKLLIAGTHSKIHTLHAIY